MDKFLPVDEILGMLRRRFVAFGTIAVLGISISLIYALGLPKLYETSAVIQIENSAVSDSLVPTQNSTRILQQLQRTEQRLMARDQLLEMISEFQLFSDLKDASSNEKVFMLRQSTRIEQVINPTLQWRTDVSPTALTITVRLGDAELVALVANRFVSNVVAENRLRREERVRDTLQFFNGEEARVGREISSLDTEIAAFKRANEGALPDSITGRRTQLASLEETDLVLEQQLIELTSGSDEDLRENVSKKIDLLEEQRQAISERRAAIEASLAAAPQVEKAFNTLQRRLELLEEQYRVITRHRAEAEMGQMLEESRQSENYEVLELAEVPEAPIAPSRKKVFAMGVMGSLALASALVYLLEILNPVIRTASQMERKLNIRPVVSIPNIHTRNDLTRAWAKRTATVLAVAIGVPVGLYLVNAHVFELTSLFDTDWRTRLAAD